MIVSVAVCLGLAIYCFTNGMVIAGVLALVGMIPGPGTVPMLICAVMLFVADERLVAVIPLLVVCWNIWVALGPKLRS